MTGNVTALPGCIAPSHEPRQEVIDAIENMLERAKRGELQSVIATGFTADGLRLALWAGAHTNVYEMLGALAWLEHEYVNRVTTPR